MNLKVGDLIYTNDYCLGIISREYDSGHLKYKVLWLSQQLQVLNEETESRYNEPTVHKWRQIYLANFEPDKLTLDSAPRLW